MHDHVHMEQQDIEHRKQTAQCSNGTTGAGGAVKITGGCHGVLPWCTLW